MKQAWKLFIQSFGVTARQFGSLIKIWLTTAILMYLITSAFDIFIINPIIESGKPAGFLPWALGFALFVFLFWVVSGLSVNTYRYLISGQYKPSWRPFDFSWSKSWDVFSTYIALALIIAGFFYIIVNLDRILLKDLAISVKSLGILAITTIILLCIVFWVGLRLLMAPISQAIDQPMGFGQAWKTTKPQWRVFAWIVFFMTLVNLFLASLGNMFAEWFFADIIGQGGFGTFFVTLLGFFTTIFMSYYFTVLAAQIFKEYHYAQTPSA